MAAAAFVRGEYSILSKACGSRKGIWRNKRFRIGVVAVCWLISSSFASCPARRRFKFGIEKLEIENSKFSRKKCKTA